jgi:hypothetical protein
MPAGAYNRATLISFGLAAAAAIAATALPLCSQMTLDTAAGVAGGGAAAPAEFHRVHCGLSSKQVLIVWLPVLFSGVAVAAGSTAAAAVVRFVAATMLAGFVIVAGFSIGLLYAPAAAAMMVAARIGHAPHGRSSTRAPAPARQA